MLQLTSELCGVHLQLIRGEGAGADRQASLANTRDHVVPKLDEEHAPAKVPGQVGRCLSAQCIACVVLLCRGGVCDCLGQSSQTMSFWLVFPPKKPPFCHLLQEALANSSRCSVSTNCVIDLALTRLYYVRLCGLSSEQQTTHSLTSVFFYSFIYRAFTQHLLFPKHCAKHWKCNSEQRRHGPCP